MLATHDSRLRSNSLAPAPARLPVRPAATALRPSRLLLTVGACIAAAGCGDAALSSNADVTRVDSAGVIIVKSPDHIGSERRLAPTPLLAIGRLDGPDEYQLFRVVGARRLSDGRIAIANAGSSEIRIYRADGRHVRSFGGEGEGPGEFTQIGRLDASAEDSLYVWDQQQLRVSVFAPDGAFVRDFKLDAPWEGGFPGYTARFEDGTLMVSAGQLVSRPPPDGEILRRESLILRYDPLGHLSDTIAAFTTRGALIRSLEGGRSFSVYSVPFDPGTRWALAGGGLHYAYGPAFEVRTNDDQGRLVRIARITRVPRLVDAALRTAATEAALADADDAARERTRETWAIMPFPDSVAAYDQLVSDAAGGVWARRYPLPGDEGAVWDVFDPSGALETAVVIPVYTTVWQMDEGLVLVSERDELDVERVSLYALAEADEGG